MLWLIQRVLVLVAAMPSADAGGRCLLELDIPRLEMSGLTVRLA